MPTFYNYTCVMYTCTPQVHDFVAPPPLLPQHTVTTYCHNILSQHTVTTYCRRQYLYAIPRYYTYPVHTFFKKPNPNRPSHQKRGCFLPYQPKVFFISMICDHRRDSKTNLFFHWFFLENAHPILLQCHCFDCLFLNC